MTYCECGKKVVVRYSKQRQTHSRNAQKGRTVALKDHDQCQRCFQSERSALVARLQKEIYR